MAKKNNEVEISVPHALDEFTRELERHIASLGSTSLKPALVGDIIKEIQLILNTHNMTVMLYNLFVKNIELIHGKIEKDLKLRLDELEKDNNESLGINDIRARLKNLEKDVGYLTAQQK